jgi:hypothetical protein
MRYYSRAFSLASLLLGISSIASSADAPAPLLSDGDYPRMVEPTVKLVQTSLAGTPNRRAADKARLAVIMLAAFAQQNLKGADAQQRATVRDAALIIAGMIQKKQFAEALKEVERLPNLPANPDAKKERVKLIGPYLDVEELMGQFRSEKVGGLGIEARLDQLSVEKGGAVSAAAMTDELRLMAVRTAVAAELAREHVPMNKAPLWQKFADQMRKSAGELADAVKTKDGKSAFGAATRLNNSCNDCHKEFR